MLSRCSNPGCTAAFLYLHRGRLFRWDTGGAHSNGYSGNSEVKRSERRVEFFWLCEDCAQHFTLVNQKGVGVTVQALATVPARPQDATARTEHPPAIEKPLRALVAHARAAAL